MAQNQNQNASPGMALRADIEVLRRGIREVSSDFARAGLIDLLQRCETAAARQSVAATQLAADAAGKQQQPGSGVGVGAGGSGSAVGRGVGVPQSAGGQNPSRPGLQQQQQGAGAMGRWDLSSTPVHSAFEVLVISAHCLLVDARLVPLEEQGSAAAGVPGFAAPIRELPAGKFMASGWRTSGNSGGTSATLLYKQMVTNKRLYLICRVAAPADSSGGQQQRAAVSVSLGTDKAGSGSGTASVLLSSVEEYVSFPSSSSSGSARDLFRSEHALHAFRAALLPLLTGCGVAVPLDMQAQMQAEAQAYATASAPGAGAGAGDDEGMRISKSSSTSYPAEGISYSPATAHTPLFSSGPTRAGAPSLSAAPYPPNANAIAPPTAATDPQARGSGGSSSNYRVDRRVGSGDLYPYPAYLPYPQPQAGAPWAGPGSGSLVGPDHPLFGGGGVGGGFGGGGMLPPGRNPAGGFAPNGLPQPRFDPFGPVAGPNGPDFGNLGVGPRRDPRAPAGQGWPGEPDPDHLKPPDMPSFPQVGGDGAGEGEGEPDFDFPGAGGVGGVGGAGPGLGRGGRGRGGRGQGQGQGGPFFSR